MKKSTCTLSENIAGDLTVADLFAYIPGHVYAKDRNGIYIACNNFNMNEGLPSKSFLGKTDSDLPWKDRAESIRRHDREVMELGKPKMFVEEGKLQDGRSAIAISFKSPLRDEDNNIIGVMGNTVEITPELAEQLSTLLPKLSEKRR